MQIAVGIDGCRMIQCAEIGLGQSVAREESELASGPGLQVDETDVMVAVHGVELLPHRHMHMIAMAALTGIDGLTAIVVLPSDLNLRQMKLYLGVGLLNF